MRFLFIAAIFPFWTWSAVSGLPLSKRTSPDFTWDFEPGYYTHPEFQGRRQRVAIKYVRRLLSAARAQDPPVELLAGPLRLLVKEGPHTSDSDGYLHITFYLMNQKVPSKIDATGHAYLYAILDRAKLSPKDPRIELLARYKGVIWSGPTLLWGSKADDGVNGLDIGKDVNCQAILPYLKDAPLAQKQSAPTTKGRSKAAVTHEVPLSQPLGASESASSTTSIHTEITTAANTPIDEIEDTKSGKKPEPKSLESQASTESETKDGSVSEVDVEEVEQNDRQAAVPSTVDVQEDLSGPHSVDSVDEAGIDEPINEEEDGGPEELDAVAVAPRKKRKPKKSKGGKKVPVSAKKGQANNDEKNEWMSEESPPYPSTSKDVSIEALTLAQTSLEWKETSSQLNRKKSHFIRTKGRGIPYTYQEELSAEREQMEDDAVEDFRTSKNVVPILNEYAHVLTLQKMFPSEDREHLARLLALPGFQRYFTDSPATRMLFGIRVFTWTAMMDMHNALGRLKAGSSLASAIPDLKSIARTVTL